jgi:hypothetical protein
MFVTAGLLEQPPPALPVERLKYATDFIFLRVMRSFRTSNDYVL